MFFFKESFIHSMIQYLHGVKRSGYAQCRKLPGLPVVPHPSPRSLCTDKGPLWISFKAIWQRVWGYIWGLSSRGVLGPLPLGIRQALREHRVSNWLSWSCSPHTECLAEAKEAVVAGRAEGCQSSASSPVSTILGGKYGNTEGLGRGSSEP